MPIAYKTVVDFLTGQASGEQIRDLSALGFPGRERLEMFGSAFPFPPYAHLLGIRLEEVGDGTTKTVMPASPWLLSPQGRVPLGMVANLADVSFGSALETRLPGGQVYTTAEMSLQRLGTAAVGLLGKFSQIVLVRPLTGAASRSGRNPESSVIGSGTGVPPARRVDTPYTG